jgi:hypothetical protein
MLDEALATVSGQPLELKNLPYRGHSVDLSFSRREDGAVEVIVRSPDRAESWVVSTERGVVASESGCAEIKFAAERGQVCRIEASWPGERDTSDGRAL